jgi:hypothetical protein
VAKITLVIADLDGTTTTTVIPKAEFSIVPDASKNEVRITIIKT